MQHVFAHRAGSVEMTEQRHALAERDRAIRPGRHRLPIVARIAEERRHSREEPEPQHMTSRPQSVGNAGPQHGA